MTNGIGDGHETKRKDPNRVDRKVEQAQAKQAEKTPPLIPGVVQRPLVK